ncbi:MAG TPA: GNAT family N-acetyltransferase, partial [Agitococcus sp.]|nr:GNAT family N-acetyltransferase [Agitococcus sp.]
MFSAPQSLQKTHVISDFDCGKTSLNDWLKRYSLQAQQSGSAKTFVVCDAQKVAAYFSLTLGQIDTFDAPDRVRQGMGQYPIPVIILARLA